MSTTTRLRFASPEWEPWRLTEHGIDSADEGGRIPPELLFRAPERSAATGEAGSPMTPRMVAVTTRDTPAHAYDAMPVVLPSVPVHERNDEAIRRTWTAEGFALGAPKPVRPAHERRRRVRAIVIGLTLAAALAVGAAIGLMPGSFRAATSPPEPTASAWAADGSGCLTNVITGAVMCPVIEGAGE